MAPCRIFPLLTLLLLSAFARAGEYEAQGGLGAIFRDSDGDAERVALLFEESFQVYDPRDPGNRPIGSAMLPRTLGEAIAVAGNTVAVSMSDATVHLYLLSPEGTPIPGGKVDLRDFILHNENPIALSPDGRLLAVLAEKPNFNGAQQLFLHLYTVDEGARPTLHAVKAVPLPRAVWANPFWHSRVVATDSCFVVGNDAGIFIYDLRNFPQLPEPTYRNFRSRIVFGAKDRLVAIEERLFAGTRLLCFDLANPEAPALVQDIAIFTSSNLDSKRFAYTNGTRFAFRGTIEGQTEQRLQILDLTTPFLPQTRLLEETGGSSFASFGPAQYLERFATFPETLMTRDAVLGPEGAFRRMSVWYGDRTWFTGDHLLSTHEAFNGITVAVALDMPANLRADLETAYDGGDAQPLPSLHGAPRPIYADIEPVENAAPIDFTVAFTDATSLRAPQVLGGYGIDAPESSPLKATALFPVDAQRSGERFIVEGFRYAPAEPRMLQAFSPAGDGLFAPGAIVPLQAVAGDTTAVAVNGTNALVTRELEELDLYDFSDPENVALPTPFTPAGALRDARYETAFAFGDGFIAVVNGFGNQGAKDYVEYLDFDSSDTLAVRARIAPCGQEVLGVAPQGTLVHVVSNAPLCPGLAGAPGSIETYEWSALDAPVKLADRAESGRVFANADALFVDDGTRLSAYRFHAQSDPQAEAIRILLHRGLFRTRDPLANDGVIDCADARAPAE